MPLCLVKSTVPGDCACVVKKNLLCLGMRMRGKIYCDWGMSVCGKIYCDWAVRR